MKYVVTVTRTEYAEVAVEADDVEEAKDLAYEEAIELDPDSQVWETISIDLSAEENE